VPPAPPGTAAGPPDDPRAVRDALLRGHLDQADAAYQAALAAGTADPVVLILDLQDRRARRTWLRLVRRAAAAGPGGMAAPRVLPASRAGALAALRNLSQRADRAVAEREPGCYLVAVVAAAGFTYAQVALPEGTESLPEPAQ
jgi:hypothetical protein